MNDPFPDRQPKSNLRMVLLAIFCILLWGSAIPCIKLSYPLFGIENGTTFDKIFFAGIRFTGAGILTLALSLSIKGGSRQLQSQHILPAIGLGLVQTTAQYVCFYIGLSNSPGARSAILNTTSTFFIVFLAALFFRSEKVTIRKLTGSLIGFLGILFVNLSGDIGSRFTWDGDFLIILASLGFAVGSIISKKLSQSENPFLLTGFQLLFGGCVLIAIGLCGGGHLPVVVPAGIGLLAYLIVLSAVAFSIWTYLLRDHDAALVSVYFFLLPIFGVVLSGIFLKERIFTFHNLAALLFVCTGIFIVNSGSKKQRIQAPEHPTTIH